MAVITLPAPTPGQQQQRFRTYYNYFKGWQMLLEDAHGSSPRCPLTGIITHRKCPAQIQGKPIPQTVPMFLRNAWSTEILLRLPLALQLGNAGNLMTTYSCAWAPVQAYYSVYSALIATSHAEGCVFTNHSKNLNFAGRLVAYPWVPNVFSYYCQGYSPIRNVSYHRQMCPPGCCQVSNLFIPSTPEEALSLARTSLKTTRDDILDKKVTEMRESKRKNNPKAIVTKTEKARLDTDLRPTTLFDFLYRVRCRCNYRETDTFIQGALIEGTSTDFLEAINSVVSHTLSFLETVICARIGKNNMMQIIDDYHQETSANRITAPVAERWGLA